MNRTTIFLGVAGMTTVVILGVIASVLLGRDAGPIVGMLTSAIAPVIALIPVFLAQRATVERQEDTNLKLREVAKNTNGNSSRMLDVIEHMLANGHSPRTETGEPLISEDTIKSIRTQNDKVGAIAEGENYDG